MSNKQDTRPRNADGQRHGYWGTYHENGKLNYKGHYINNELIGYSEDFWNDEIDVKEFCLR